ncbi:thermonuclease family protein [Pararhizobium mangrovi]|uniref:Thermonuclease family protein n=1 Tax=Pararhizobium mangrovi TaxID=2590452 RepID=A0A506UCP3_9HYPH|nr:thermonuclease family protein [Pararhizobium mangrovi]TPW31186.1 thermonuclease family protein [Pararhizobium mangrovi]
MAAVMRRTIITAALMLCATPAFAIPICHGSHRAERKVTCLIDGDSGWQDGVKWRYAAIDAPEMGSHASCPREKRLAKQSRDRLRALMADGYTVNDTGETGYYGRKIVTITLADGRDAGDVLMSEGLAQKWPNHGNPWCR